MWGTVKSREFRKVPAAKGGGSATTGGAGGGREVGVAAWELRPGGMLVQKRNSDMHNQSQTQVPIIKVKVKYGSTYHEVNIKSQSTFGELKKLLAKPTGLNPLDQKIVFRDKERESKTYLDEVGVKDGSRMVLFDDILSREKRLVENLRNTKTDKAKMEIIEISKEVDKLAKQVGNLEIEIYGGKKVDEKVLLNLIELLMSLLIKLDGIAADGDVKLQRRMQVKRVQRYIELLDALKICNSKIISIKNGASIKAPSQRNSDKISFEQKLITPLERQRDSIKWPIVVTTDWEKF